MTQVGLQAERGRGGGNTHTHTHEIKRNTCVATPPLPPPHLLASHQFPSSLSRFFTLLFSSLVLPIFRLVTPPPPWPLSSLSSQLPLSPLLPAPQLLATKLPSLRFSPPTPHSRLLLITPSISAASSSLCPPSSSPSPPSNPFTCAPLSFFPLSSPGSASPLLSSPLSSSSSLSLKHHQLSREERGRE